MRNIEVSKTTVADELAFEALPIEVQELAQRILGKQSGGFTEDEMEDAYKAGFEDACKSTEVNTPDEIEDAYKAGFEDACKSTEVNTPHYDKSYFDDFISYRR